MPRSALSTETLHDTRDECRTAHNPATAELQLTTMINLCRAACAAPKGLSRGCQAARRQLAAAGLPESERSQLGEGPVLLWRTRSYAGTSAGNLRCPGRSSLTAPTRPPPVPRQPGPLASHRRGQASLSAVSSARA